jgi:aconitate hydratase
MSVYDAAMKYLEEGVPLLVLAGKEYGAGSSRDWAAKGTLLLGIKAVVAESYERIHRSNLIGMGVLPLQFKHEDSVDSLGLSGKEVFSIQGLNDEITPVSEVTVKAVKEDSSQIVFKVIVRLDTPTEIEYYRNGGILHTVLRNML